MAIAADKALVTIDGEFSVVRPLTTAVEAAENFREYKALTAALLEKADFQTFNEGGKQGRFIKKRGLRKLATYYGFTIEMLDERLGHKHDEATCARIKWPEVMKGERDCGCRVVFARYVVKVTAPNGRVVVQPGICSTGERRPFTRPDHDVAMTAYTRAASRAIADMIGVSEPEAEEAKESGVVQGLSREDQDAITEAWRKAAQSQRDAALAQMRSWGNKGETSRQLFTEFNLNGSDDQVAALIATLDELPFDPAKVEPEPLPTQGGRT